LVSRLFAWRCRAHDADSLASVRPLSLIIDNASITILAKLHPQNITDHRQIRTLLGQTLEWEAEWSKSIFEVIQQFNNDLITLRKMVATQKKTRQKRIKITQDLMSFEQDTKENEERIRAKVLREYEAQQKKLSKPVGPVLQMSSIDNCSTSTR
jgi:hypothetical protein